MSASWHFFKYFAIMTCLSKCPAEILLTGNMFIWQLHICLNYIYIHEQDHTTTLNLVKREHIDFVIYSCFFLKLQKLPIFGANSGDISHLGSWWFVSADKSRFYSVCNVWYVPLFLSKNVLIWYFNNKGGTHVGGANVQAWIWCALSKERGQVIHCTVIFPAYWTGTFSFSSVVLKE